MKKNFLGKFMVLAAMIYAGFTLSSCDEKDNPSGNNWTELKVTNKTATSATVTANSASEVNSLIASLSKDIKAAVTDGKDYTITIDVPSLKVTETNHTISLPAPASGEDGGTLILYIKNSFSTDGTPLLVKSNEAYEGNWSYNSNSKAEILLPAGISDIDLEINMPHTTVTLDSKGNATIDELISTTGWETLNIESGVTVNWLMLKGGKVVVKDGGKVLGILASTYGYIDVTDKGICDGRLYKKEIPEAPTADDYYYADKAKIIKDKFAGAANITIRGYEEAPENEVQIIISDGARAEVSSYQGYNYYPAVNVTGEGDAKIMYYGNEDNGKVYPSSTMVWLSGIKMLSNVTVDRATVLLWKPEKQKYEEVELEEGIKDIDLTLPQNAENCEFITIDELTDPFFYRGYILNDDIITSTFKNCKITFKTDGNGSMRIYWPKQTKDRTSFKLNFDTCELNNVKFDTGFKWDEDPENYDNYKVYVSLDNSKMDGKAITKDTDLIRDAGNLYNYTEDKAVTTTYYNIDGTTYIPTWDETAGKWKLVEPEAE